MTPPAAVVPLEAKLAEVFQRVEAHTVRNAQTKAITGYMVPADEWRSIRAHLAAVLAPVVAGAVERAVEEAAVRVECEATNAGTARDFVLAEAARLVREGGQPS